MRNVVLKDASLYEENKEDFGLIEEFDKILNLAIRRSRRLGLPYTNEMENSNYCLIPSYCYDFHEETPHVTIEMYLDDDVYIDSVDNAKYKSESIENAILAVTPGAFKVSTNVIFYARSFWQPAGVEPWRNNPQYHFRDEIEAVSQETIEKIWGTASSLHVFISHKADKKTRAYNLKRKLSEYGISSFVAHDDIEPAEEWQVVIEKALFSSDALIALICEDFSSSKWADQEVGIAIGRQLPVYPVRLSGKANPYGFIGKIQAFEVKDNTIETFVMRFAVDSRTASATISSLLKALNESSDAKAVESIVSMLAKTVPAIWKVSQKDAFLSQYKDKRLVAGSLVAQKLFDDLGLKKHEPISGWGSPDDDEEIPF